MLQINGLCKSYGTQALLEDVSFNLSPGERLGVVGRNGHGKSTLFRMLLGEEQIDSGSVKVPGDYKLGHLSQKLVFSEATVLEEACLGLPEQEGGWKETYKAETILHGLGFSDADFQVSPSQLSGGFQIRLNLAKLLVSEPNLLLLDEPTNYLDLPSVRWLVRFLQSWPHELMLITHDRGFMDQVTTHTLAIHRGGIKKIEGNTKKLYEQIAIEEEVHEKTRVNLLKKREKTEEFVKRFRAKASKAAAVQSKIKALDKMGELEELAEVASLSFRFNASPFQGKFVCTVKNLCFGFTKDAPLISEFNLSVHKDDRIGVIGANGKGKTTLLNLIAGDLSPWEGEIEFSENTQLSYFGQTNVDRLDPERTIEEAVFDAHPDNGRTLVRSLCGAMMFEGDLALKKIRVLSGGERSRVLLAKVLAKPCNMLLLDEPTNHLDMQSAEELRDAIAEFQGAVMFVTHDESLLRETATRLVVFDGQQVSLFEGNYDDFLRRVGWNSESDLPQSERQQNGSGTLSKKELRRLRAEEQKKRREALKPIERKISKIEKEIIAAEEQQAEQQQTLIEITKDGYGDDAVKLARSISKLKNQIEQLFSELEELSEQQKQLFEKFDANERLSDA